MSSMRAAILIVDDEIDMLKLLKRSLAADLDCEIDTASNALAALEKLDSAPYDLVLADVRMPGMTGMEFLEIIKKNQPAVTVIMMTAFGSIDLAVEAIKKGAYDFITKPFEHDKLVHLIQNALERTRLVRENVILQQKVREHETFHKMIGSSPKMLKIFEMIRLIGKTDVTVLITGESGTGKDMAAKAIHDISGRNLKPFVPVNCPNLPESILESELFGYKKGAFTHATQDKNGLFWEAQGGTIYLDEIGDISGTLQTKLLRVLQEKEIRPLGETKTRKVDVRIISSTNQNLEQRIQENLFRQDLFYRLNVLSIQMPPLRERKEDIPLLVAFFLEKYAKEYGQQQKKICSDLMQRFIDFPWRGNVRELENTVSRAVLLSGDDEICFDDVGWQTDGARECWVTNDVEFLDYKQAKAAVLNRFHKQYFGRLFAKTNSNITRAAKECGLERQALQQIMKRYNISREDIPD